MNKAECKNELERCLTEDNGQDFLNLIMRDNAINSHYKFMVPAWRSDGVSLIGCAAGNGKIGCLQKILDNATLLENKELELANAVFDACAGKHHDCLQLLLKYDASPNTGSNSSGLTPLHISARQDDVTSIDILLSHGADPNVIYRPPTDPELRMAPLMLTHDPQCMESLCKNGASVDPYPGSTLYQDIMATGDLKVEDCIRVLIKHCAPLGRLHHSIKYTPLSFACKRGLVGCVRAFIGAGADVDQCVRIANANYSSLYFAVDLSPELKKKTDSVEIVNLLLDCAKKETINGWKNDSAVMSTVIRYDNVDVLKSLVGRGWDIFCRVDQWHVKSENNFWLFRAVGKDFESSRCFLFMLEISNEKGIDLNQIVRNQYRENLLHCASAALNIHHIRALLDNKMNPNLGTRDGLFPIDIVMENLEKEGDSVDLSVDAGSSLSCLVELIRAGGKPSSVGDYFEYVQTLRCHQFPENTTWDLSHSTNLLTSPVWNTHLAVLHSGCPEHRLDILEMWISGFLDFLPHSKLTEKEIITHFKKLWPPHSLKMICRDRIRRELPIPTRPAHLRPLHLPLPLESYLNFIEFDSFIREYCAALLAPL